jgi:UDP-3-O-[3-hydroxymyristoyl] N-acetylglucosamine deacetylase
MHVQQRTVAGSVTCTGIGLHSGKKVNLCIKPADPNHGIKFIRTDLPDSPGISALFNRVVDTSLATVIGCNGFIVSTIEHLMATFAGLSIDNARVELDDYEVPVMDGSAGPFTQMIKDVGIKTQEMPRHFFVVKKPIELKQNGKSVAAYPSNTPRITCNIDFNHKLVKQQTFTINFSDRSFEENICRARTFGFLSEIEYLKRYGFARGGSLDNAVVLSKCDIVNEGGLRYRDEFVRHKLLDCIGDFSLLGLPILGHLVLNKSGHAFNHEFLRKFLERKNSWETRTFPEMETDVFSQPKSLAI